MSNVCIVVIATNNYINFLNPLLESINNFFLKNHNVSILLFTNHDAKRINELNNNSIKIEISYIEHKPWPLITLLRYHVIKSKKIYLKDNFDYIFYCDVDMLLVDNVGDEIIPDFDTVVATVHPGFWDKPKEYWTFESRQESLAYTPVELGLFYVAGGFQGGTTDSFIKAADVISSRIDDDLRKNLIALWHDESHWNHYVSIDLRNKVKFLSPSYCYPENFVMPWEKKILALDKDHLKIRN